MRTADETELRLCVGVLPDDGITLLNAFQLRVVDDIGLRVLCNQLFTLLDRVRRESSM
jgi:hypothetical protein